MKHFALLATVLAALGSVPSAAAQEPADAGGPLVYLLVFDGVDGDRVDQGGAPFLGSLLAGREEARATLFKESRSVMIAETNPNHVAMATGDYADRSGIAGNAFAVYAQGEADDDGCPQGPVDETLPPHVTSGESAGCVQSETFFESTAGAASITTAGIFGKPKLGRLFAQEREGGGYAADYLWAPCEGSGDPDYCASVPINPATRYALSDGVVMDELLRTVREGVPADGAVKRPNLTFVNFPQGDSAGHGTGTGAAYDEAIAMADAELRRFVEQQKELGLWERTVMLVMSDHSMDETGQKTSLAQRFDAAGIESGSYEIVQNGSVDMVYLTDRADPARFDLLRRMRAAAMTTLLAPLGAPDVDQALYREPNPVDGGNEHTLETVHPNWNNDGSRTGDLFVTHSPGGAFNDPANPLAGNHGGPQTMDNFLAVIGGSPLLANTGSVGGEVAQRFDDTHLNPQASENVDVAPTALGVLGQRPPAQNRGRFLKEAFDLSRFPDRGAGLPGVKTGGKARKPRIRLRAKPRRVRVGRRVRVRFRALVPRNPAIAPPVRCRAAGPCLRGAGRVRLRPLRRAVVRFAGKRARTNRKGYTRIRKRLRRAGRYRATAAKKGFRKGRVRVRAVRRRG